MNRVIGFAFFLLLLAAVAFITLKDMKPIASSNADTVFTGVDWRPLSIGDETVPDNSRLLLRFEVDGKLNGNGGCNSFFGNYTISESGIDIGPLGATRMGCPPPQMLLETQFFDVLDRTAHIETRDNRLILSDASRIELAVFVQATEAAVENP